MVKHCILIWGFVLLTAFAWGQNQALKQLQEAEVLLDSLRYQEAAMIAKRTLETQKNPEINAQALILLGDIAQEQRDYPQAQSFFLRSLKTLQAFSTKGHPLIAQAWNNLGQNEFHLNNFDRAIQWHQNALQLRTQLFGPKHEKVADSYNNLGNCQIQLGNYAAAKQMHEKALKIRQSALPAQHVDIAISHNNLGNCAYFVGDFQEAAREYQAGLSIREKIYGSNHLKITPSLNNLGKVLYELGQWDQALAIFRRVLSIRQKSMAPNSPALASTYENIGEVLLEKGDFHSAIPYLQQAVFLHGGQENPNSAAAWHKIGLCLQRSGDYDAALNYHIAALKPIETLFGDQVYAASIYNNLGLCYMQKRVYKHSILNFGIAARILRQNFPQGHPDLAQMYNSMALCYSYQGFVDSAAINSRLAIQALQQIGQAQGIPYSQVLRTHAEVLLLQGKIAASSQVLQDALKTLAYRKGQNLWGGELSEEVMEILAQQSRTWKAEAISSKNPATALRWLKQAAEVNLEALRLLSFLRRQVGSSNAQQIWLQKRYGLYRVATDLHFRIWQQTKDRRYLEKAFELSEKSKAAQLFDAVQVGQSDKPKQIPEKWAKLEQTLRQKLAELEVERIASPSKSARFERQMLGLMQRRDSLQKVIKQWEKQKGLDQTQQDTAYPAAFLQKHLLKPKQALIEYFETESSLLVFVLRKKTIQGFALPKSQSLPYEVKRFRILLRLYPALNGSALDSNLLSWCQLSHSLYRRVFQPIQAALQGVEELMIIPDGPLSYVPFESLLCKMPDHPAYFKSHAYLLRQFPIQYNYSGSLAWELCRKSRPAWFKPKVLSMAPEFKQHALGLGDLYNNKIEANKVGSIWKGKVLLGKQATLANFLHWAPNSQIFHLATHGKYFIELNNYSAVAFAEIKDTLANDYLYTRDLYAMHLPAEMVVLSACETGVGDYHSGEGVISLVHGFLHAGAKSVVNTLWSVDDARTADLVVDFFRLLKKGERKDHALQAAKLNLLQQRPHDEVHPYYWAGLVGVGAAEAVYAPMGVYLLFGGVILFLLCLYLGRNLKKKHNL